ncbi:MAG: single-stranded-DNA-specific exonuclease RecJ [Planctomycetota bacterium]|nr:single-stranded-DNA-specific exonuclease RecJ [Planctomycetota bacterium]
MNMERIWQVIPHDADLVQRLENSAKVSPVVAQLLAARGITHADEIQKFLSAPMQDLHDPGLLPNMEAGARVLFESAKSKKKIRIYGDYDCDGMSGTAILVNGLRLIGADVSYFIPNRLEDGYGLNQEAIETLKSRGTDLIVTVDCGVASLDEIQFANDLGLKVIVTDHHEMQADLPAAEAVIHPKLPIGNYPFDGICGAGVAFKLIWAVFRLASGSDKVQPEFRDFLVEALGLASIGTVADVVPLLDENRIIVKHGLKSLQKSNRTGIKSLLKVCKLTDKASLGADDIGFAMGPRLNAAGRLGQAQLGVELLTTDSVERAESLAEYIDGLNASRVSLERSVYLAATKQIKENFDPENDPAMVLDGIGWHAGVIGIIAGRIAEKYHRPTVIISWDKLGMKPGVGSARSAGTLSLNKAFESCGQHLISYGGHAAAAGLKIEHQKIDAFRSEFLEYCSMEMTAADRNPLIRIDAEVLLPHLTLSTMESLGQMAPFGHSNPRPRFCATHLAITGDPKTMGGGDRHLTFNVCQNDKSFRVVAFGQGEMRAEIASLQGEIDLVFHPVVNEFRGLKRIELHLIDWRPSKPNP